MAGYKETPRQKMIAMMYLVLTALLALNVSKEMLDAFIVVNESVEKTQENFSDKIESSLSEFQKQHSINPKKVDQYWEKAQQAKKLSEDMIAYIDSLKYALIVVTDGQIETMEQARNTPLMNIQAKDRYTEPTRFFFGSDASIYHNQPAGKLQDSIIAYRNHMLDLINEPDSSSRLGLRTEGPYFDADGNRVSWAQHNFYYTILAADVTILNKVIAEVKNAEFDVISELYKNITAEDFKFDQIEAKVIPKRSYILQGEKYEAEVLVAAYDTKQEPEVFVVQGANEWKESYMNRAREIDGEKGMVELTFPGNTVGPKTYAGVIKVKNPEGELISYPFSADYIVAPPSLTVAATKMNVFYIGVDNPVSISVPGMAEENISPRITEGGTLSRVDADDHNYIVNVTKGMREAVVSASARYEGNVMDMGSRTFRVKRVPDPVAKIAGIREGNVEKNTLLAAGAIIPAMEDFEFELYFRVKSFTMGTVINGDWVQRRANGNRFSGEMMNIIRDASRGQKFFFESIQAEGDDGTTRTLNSINLTIN